MSNTYREQVWHYLVRTAPEQGRHYRILEQTDNEQTAFETCQNCQKPAHVYNVWRDEVEYKNYR